MTDISTNVNFSVRVKLTDLGRKILRENDERLMGKFPGLVIGHVIADDGTYRTQLWSLMHDFGGHMFCGGRNPFDTEIVIEQEVWPRMAAVDLGLNPVIAPVDGMEGGK